MLVRLMKRRIQQLLIEDDGQDLIEYALLCTFIGFASIAAIDLLGVTMNNTYESWDAGVKELWEVPDPEPIP